MAERCFEDILRFVRRDGPVDAPICFLTIEDGGDFWGTEPRTTEVFLQSFHSSPAWTPSDRKFEKLGKPGQYLSKLMLAIFSGSLDKWSKYRDERLYLANECNIKFYPIGRRNTGYWCDEFSAALGLTHDEYLEQCVTQRPEIISATYPQAFDRSQLHIIVGAKAEWRCFLKKFCYRGHLQLTQYKTTTGKLMYETYFEAEILAFCYFDVFRRGITDQEILEFAVLVSRHLPDNVRSRVKLFA